MEEYNKTFAFMKEKMKQTWSKNKDNWKNKRNWKNGEFKKDKNNQTPLTEEKTVERHRHGNKKGGMPMIVPLILIICAFSWLAICCIIAKKKVARKTELER